MAIAQLPTTGVYAPSDVAFGDSAEMVESGMPVRLNTAGKLAAAVASDGLEAVIGVAANTAEGANQPMAYIRPNRKITGLSGLTKGAAYYLAPGTNEVQSIDITGTPTGGTFTVTYDGQTTAAIAYNANAAALQTALENLNNIEVGDVAVTGTNPNFAVEFTGLLAAKNVSEMTADGALLTGGTTPDAVVSTDTPGLGRGRVCLFSDLSSGDAIVLVGIAPSATELLIIGKDLQATI